MTLLIGQDAFWEANNEVSLSERSKHSSPFQSCFHGNRNVFDTF